MIRFSCKCGHPYELPDERANDEFQCPACLRLVQAPGLGDADAMDVDGTLKMRDLEPNVPDLVHKMQTHSHRVDQRQTLEEYLSLDDAPAADAPPTKRPPRYDPFTGELLEDIELKPDPLRDAQPKAHQIPMATATLNYATTPPDPDTPVRGDITWWTAPWRIVTGMSFMAILFVFLTHVLIHVCIVTPFANLLLWPFAFLGMMAVVAHYGNVIEEIGVQNHDEVPVMLRHVSFSEDVLHPLYGVTLAGLIALSPLILVVIVGLAPTIQDHAAVWIGLGLCAGFIFPAAAFTAISSGAIQNMLPQHFLSVIGVAPAKYLMACGTFISAFILYVFVLRTMGLTSYLVLTGTTPFAGISLKMVIGIAWIYAWLAIAVYLMHLSMVWLGLIYRKHHGQFNWVYQQHQKRHRDDTLAQLAQMRRQGDPRLKNRRHPTPQQMADIPQAESAPKPTHSQTMPKI